jgi:hypothetical protein
LPWLPDQQQGRHLSWQSPSKAVASDQPEALSVQRRGDVSVLLLGDNFERYEIVDALVVGG